MRSASHIAHALCAMSAWSYRPELNCVVALRVDGGDRPDMPSSGKPFSGACFAVPLETGHF